VPTKNKIRTQDTMGRTGGVEELKEGKKLTNSGLNEGKKRKGGTQNGQLCVNV